METLQHIIAQVNDLLWTYILIAMLLGCALYFTWRTRFVQFRNLREMLRLTKTTDGKAVYLTYNLTELSALRGTVIANHGYSDLIMDAARAAGAAGGTVIHAKGTGMEGAEKFLGITLAAEKEMIFVVVKSAQKNDIMSAIMKHAGMESKAKSICFTLPVSATAGLRLVEDD